MICGVPLHEHDLDEAAEGLEVIGISCVERKASRTRCRGDEEVYCPRAASLSASTGHGGIDPAVRPRGLGIEGQRIENGLCALQSILSTRTLIRVRRGVWPGGEFGHRDRADC